MSNTLKRKMRASLEQVSAGSVDTFDDEEEEGRRRGRRWLWSQDDERMLWGLFPVLTYKSIWRLVFEWATIAFVINSIAVIILTSYESHDSAESSFYFNRVVTNVFFTVEYCIRLIAIRPSRAIPRPFSREEFMAAKVAHALSFMGVVDLLSILPFYIEMIAGQEYTYLAVFRVIRVLRIFKLTRGNQTLVDFFAAIGQVGRDLLVFAIVVVTMVIMAGTAIYYAERDADSGFDNIPLGMWWSIVTFTSVGYGDMYPVTTTGRLIGAAACVLGVFLMNVPIAFVLFSFDSVYSKRQASENRMREVVTRMFKWHDRHSDPVPSEADVRSRLLKRLATKRLAGNLTPAKLDTLTKAALRREIYNHHKQRKLQEDRLHQQLMAALAAARVNAGTGLVADHGLPAPPTPPDVDTPPTPPQVGTAHKPVKSSSRWSTLAATTNRVAPAEV